MAATYPLDAQIACVEREIAMRRAVYANRVRDRKMTQAAADTEIGRMEAVLATLRDDHRTLTIAVDTSALKPLIGALERHAIACSTLLDCLDGETLTEPTLAAAKEVVASVEAIETSLARDDEAAA